MVKNTLIIDDVELMYHKYNFLFQNIALIL